MIQRLSPPDVSWPQDGTCVYRPSWSSSSGYLNEEHAVVWKETKDLPGAPGQEVGAKLYEMAYRSGAVLLEIGLSEGGSSAVALRGALRAAHDRCVPSPQYYGVVLDSGAVSRIFRSLQALELDRFALLYHGSLSRFHRDVPITPTMVGVAANRFSDVWANLRTLSTFLAPGTPVLCQHYVGTDNVKRAVDAWVHSGYYDLFGVFGCSVLLRASARCVGQAEGLSMATFGRLQNALVAHYLDEGGGKRTDRPITVRDVMAQAQAECGPARPRTKVLPNGMLMPEGSALPPTLPDGRPWPRISVVTPSYNQGRFLEETILSVVNQGYPNVEHIIIDGGSTDQTQEILARYRHRLVFVVSETDRGQSHALNKGFAQATGDILTWLNSDDRFAPGALAAMAMAFQTSGADLVAGICQLHQDNVLVDQHLTSCPDGPLPLGDLLDLENGWSTDQFFRQPEVFFTRGLWERAGGYVDESAPECMDYELWLRFAAAGGRLHVIGRPIAISRGPSEQQTAVVKASPKGKVAIRDAFLARTGRAPWTGRPASSQKHPLRIALVNDSGFDQETGITHERMAQTLANAGHEVYAVALASRAGQGAAGGDLVRALEKRPPDLVLIGALDRSEGDPSLPGLLAARWPTAIVLHDFWLLPDRCLPLRDGTPADKGGNDECPTADESPALPPDTIADDFHILPRASDQPCAPALFACSRGAQATALRLLHPTEGSPLMAGAASVGHLGLPLDVFRPRPQSECREFLGLPPDAFIVLCGVDSHKKTSKRVKHVIEALSQRNLPDLVLLLVGQATPEDCRALANIYSLGIVRDPLKRALAYGAADVFVGPSLAEPSGQTFMEAAACGVPSLGSPEDGVGHAIRDGVTGRLAPDIDPVALADTLEELYSEPQWRQDMSRWARLYAENEWSFAKAYHRLFSALSEAGLRERVGMSRKFAFSLQPVQLEDVDWRGAPKQGWAPGNGFGPWEGPYPQQGLPRCIWCQGPQSSLDVSVEATGVHTILIRCLNYEKGQWLRVFAEDHELLVQEIPVASSNADVFVLTLTAKLKAGKNRIDLFPWRWTSNSDSVQRRALLLLGVDHSPDQDFGACPGGDSGPLQMAACD